MMTRKLLLCFALGLLLPSLYCSEKSGFERNYKFKWDSQLIHAIRQHQGSDEYFFPRLAQIYAESGFNPRATSDFKGWKRGGIDTVTAIRDGMGAAGLVQFIWATGVRYGAISIRPAQADALSYSPDIYNPLWGIDAMCRYMHSIEMILLRTRNPKARRVLLVNRQVMNMMAIASYNTGEGRVLDRINRYGTDWQAVKARLPAETQGYVERIMRFADEMRLQARWKESGHK